MQQTYSQADVPNIEGARVAILQAKWYAEHTDTLVVHATRVLVDAGVESDAIDHHVVPGSYELPLAAKRLAEMQCYDAVIVIGAIIKGQTYHFEMIVDTCTDLLGKVMYDYDLPILMEVLAVMNEEQLIARASDNDQNKGIEAAMAAAEIIAWRRGNPKPIPLTDFPTTPIQNA